MGRAYAERRILQQLHILAAGSLLEFALEELPTFGGGRIDSQFGEASRFVGLKASLQTCNKADLDNLKRKV